jgi:rhamnopyranosyl-N-acetylglucosaminyl-diphospho-decaprenol beta-1,3/1,4-galactofuranosyltransferase
MASFVGILIPRDSINKVGLPRKEFFIHHDDTEYSLRLLSIGKLWMDNQSKIYHKELRQEEKCKKCFFYICKNRVKFEKLWLKYFGLRNSVYIALKYSSNKFVFLDILKIYFTLIKDIILFDDHKWVRIKFATSSVLDGVFGIFDNKKPKRILNEFTKL